MKKSICLAASLIALTFTSTFGQPTPPSAPPPAPQHFQQRLQTIIQRAGPGQNQPFAIDPTTGLPIEPKLTKFNLDFPGGTPKELVAAIEKAMGKPLNVIIPDEDAATKLPALKLNEITFPQLSDTLRVGSTKSELVWLRNANGSQYNQMVTLGYYFKTTDERPTDNSVWFFSVTKKPEQAPQPPVEKACQFYSLSPYLDRGFTVDDITTAIQTGWKMAGETPTPELNYHKETKLLIAFGEPNKLQTIQQVLQTLPSVNQEYWRQANDRIRELQKQVDLLNKQLNPPPGDSNPIYRQLLEKRQSEMNVSTNTPAEKSGK